MSGSVRAVISRRQTTKQTNMKSKTESIISALRVLARDIQTDDGVVNACLEEAAERLEELQRANKNTLADLAVAIERRDDSYAEIKTVRKELAQALAERTPHDYGLLKGEVDNLKRELSEAIRERNKTVADLIKQRDEALKNQQPTTVVQQLTTRPEPSRLEIAAMLLAAMCGSQYTWTNAEGLALRKADTLIAAAKEVQS
jgi:hypothetical protein